MFGIQFALDLVRNNGQRRRRTEQYRPGVQTLEDRYLLSTFQEFPLPDLPRNPQDQFHRERVTTGADGNLWFIDGVYGFSIANMRVGRMAPDGSVTEFPIEDHTLTQLYNITAGPDGNLWMLAIRAPEFTSNDQLVVIRMAPDGSYTVFGAFLGHPAFGEDFVSNVSPLVVGADGNLWYTASFYTQFPGIPDHRTIVGRITPDGDVTNFDAGESFVQLRDGGGMTADANGNLLIGLFGVRQVSPDGQLSDPIPGSNALSEMVTGANGNVWGVIGPRSTGAAIERIAPDGTVTDFALPVSEPIPVSEPVLDPAHMTITVGPDGNIWFSDPYANQIGNITPDGTVTEYAVPTPDSFPAGITTGPDGNIWFTEMGSGQIGEFVLNDAGQASEATRTASIAAMDAVFAGAPQESLQSVVREQLTLAATAGVGEVLPPPSDVSAVPELTILSHQHKPGPARAADPAGLSDVVMEKVL
jgi:streptogramin lyase